MQHRSPESKGSKNLHIDCEVAAGLGKHVVLRHQRSLDGAYERVSNLSSNRVQEVSGRHLLDINCKYASSADTAVLQHAHRHLAPSSSYIQGRLSIAAVLD